MNPHPLMRIEWHFPVGFSPRRLTALAACVAALALAAPRPAPAQTDTFVYQGNLELNGAPVNGLTDILFNLWDAPSNGFPLTFDTRLNVNVENGFFSTEVFFDPEFFSGAALWLQVNVRHPAGTMEAYTTLTPRRRGA